MDLPRDPNCAEPNCENCSVEDHYRNLLPPGQISKEIISIEERDGDDD